MKKLISILILSFAVITANAQAQPAGCCPKFKLSTDLIIPCDDTTCKSSGNPAGGNGGQMQLVACKNQQQTYYVVPGLPGFSYSWTVVGGTIVNVATNPGVITWGNGSSGYIQVIIKNADSTCRDTITAQVCILSGPTAGITFSPNPVCMYAPVTFSGITSVGASNYYWDFGDGTYSTLQNPPPHTYTTPGPKPVILTVSTSTSINGVTRDCGCKDTAMVIVNVSDKAGINIYTDDCRKMLCTGDTIKYCTNTPGCTGLTWSVSGGSIVGSSTGTCVNVVWDQPSTFPTSVTLNANCPNTCGNAATLNVPVLYPNLPIQGTNIVCPGTVGTYSLPALPGTFYKWTVSGGGTIVGPDSNHNIIKIQWGSFPGGPFVVTCNYNNPYSGCSGKDTMHVYIRPKFTLTGQSPVCVGQTTSICANGAVATWTYFPVTGFNVVSSPGDCKNIKWNIPGSYSITATPLITTNYCTPSATINILALDTPKINAITGPLVVCPGQTVMYSITSNINAGTFNWVVTGGTVQQYMGAHKDSMLVQFSGSGTVSVYQTVNGCSSYTQLINVSVITGIGPITGNSPTCIDAVEVYSIAGPVPPGGYTWTLSNALGAIIYTTANSITVQWNGAGSSAACTITAAACSQNATKVVTVNNPPNGTLTGTGNLCTPGVVLTTSLAMPSHDWYKNGVFYVNSGASNTITVTTPGFYKVKSPTPCYGTASINVPNTFTSSVTISADKYINYCTGITINFNLIATVQANNTCTFSYQWYNGATPVGTNSPSYNVTGPGSYTVIISCGNCKDTSNIINVTQGPCSPDCVNNYVPYKAIGNDIGGPSDKKINENEEALLLYSLVINPPAASPCNVVTFNATYNFSSPNSVNSGVFWDFGDGNTATSPTGPPVGTFTSTVAPHTYATPGIYVVTAWMYSNCPTPPPAHTCLVRDTIHYIVPVAANFGYNKNCNQVTLSDLSTTLPSLSCSISAWGWSVSGPTGSSFNNPSAQNPILTVTQSGTYSITLLVTSNCGGCQATVTYPVIITLPSATFTPPSPICAGTPAPFSVAGPATNSYNWNFGDGYQSNLQSTTHSFAAAGTSQVILTVTDQYGCVVKDTQMVTILPKLIVTIPGNQYICPGAGFTLTTTPTFTNYQWYFNGNAISGATNPTYYATNIGEYYVIVNNGTGCIAQSNKMKIWHHPKPIANIQGQTIQCINSGSGNLYLYNIISDPNYTYAWTVTPAATFSPNNNQYDANVTVNATGTYQFILTVTDITTGCIAKDTFCVYAYDNPTVTIAPTGYLCEGITHIYTATPAPAGPNYVYQWSNGATGPTMSTGLPGNYYVTLLNTLTGCYTQSNTVTIKKRPYVALFPIGCDTLCDTAKLIPPLPLGPGQNYGGVYVIKWYVDGNLYFTGSPLVLSGIGLGQHQIYIVVNFIGDSCAATSGKYDLFIKHCGDCDCEKKHWGEIQLTQGEKVKAPASAKNNVKANVPTPIILKCNAGQKLDCNKTYTIDASFFCKDTACDKKITYVLQPGVGSPITGSLPLTFTTPNSNTTYVLTLYGWCGDKICDSCVIDLIVKCDSVDCCKGSVWEATPWYAFEKGSKQKINCNEKEQVIDISGDLCKQKLTFGAKIKCQPNCISADSVFVYDAGNNVVQSGSAPLTLNTLPDGTYTVELVGYCGGAPCLKCKIILKINCDKKCDCNEKEPIQLSASIDGKVKQIKCDTEFGKLDCNKTIILSGTYSCTPKDCPSNLTYTMTGPGGPVNGTLPLSINTGVLANGTYTILIQAYCNGKLCKECKITFTVECERPCCPYKIEATAGTVNYSPTPTATIAAQTFTINGLGLANITEVRANVISYTIDDNYKGDCMKCVNLPFTWASAGNATNIGTAPPKITMYGGTTVSSFNGTGAGAYQNPREIIWNNGTNLNTPAISNIGMSFILPPTPAIDCCELKGKICVKFTFRDNDCKECEVIVCFDFVIKKK